MSDNILREVIAKYMGVESDDEAVGELSELIVQAGFRRSAAPLRGNSPRTARTTPRATRPPRKAENPSESTPGTSAQAVPASQRDLLDIPASSLTPADMAAPLAAYIDSLLLKHLGVTSIPGNMPTPDDIWPSGVPVPTRMLKSNVRSWEYTIFVYPDGSIQINPMIANKNKNPMSSDADKAWRRGTVKLKTPKVVPHNPHREIVVFAAPVDGFTLGYYLKSIEGHIDQAVKRAVEQASQFFRNYAHITGGAGHQSSPGTIDQDTFVYVNKNGRIVQLPDNGSSSMGNMYDQLRKEANRQIEEQFIYGHMPRSKIRPRDVF